MNKNEMVTKAVEELTEYYTSHPDWLGRVDSVENDDVAAFVKVHFSIELSESEISDIRQAIVLSIQEKEQEWQTEKPGGLTYEEGKYYRG